MFLARQTFWTLKQTLNEFASKSRAMQMQIRGGSRRKSRTSRRRRETK
jgi:hypothetical protein